MDLKEISSLLNFSGPLEEGIRIVKDKTENLSSRLEGSPVEEEEPSIGREGEEILTVISSSSFDEYEGGLVKILSKVTLLRPKEMEEMKHPKTGVEGFWVPSTFSEPNLYQVWEERGRKSRENDEPGDNVEYPIGSVIVLLRNPNSSSYEVGIPILVLKKLAGEDYLFQGVDPRGNLGNFLPTAKGDARAATPEEIDSLFESLPR
jgi:hypothetical protein